MDDDRIWTAEELEQLSSDERKRMLAERVVTDLSTLPPEFLARVRREGRALLESRGMLHPDRR
jgi:hypothetical protein